MPHNLKLTQVSCSLSDSLGGPTRVVKESHIRIASLCNSKLVVFGQSADYSGVEVFPSLFNNRYGLPRKFLWNRSVEYLKDSDVILMHGFYTFATLFALTHGERDSRYLLMPHGSLEDYQRAKSKLLKFIFRMIFAVLIRNRDFTFVLASEEEKPAIQNQFPNLAIEIIGIGIEFLGDPTVRQRNAATLNLVCISRIAKKKRIDLCIRAVKLIRDEGIDVELHILGSGESKLTSSLKELVQLLDLDQAVHFHGHLTRNMIREILPQMHIFLLPSENENFAIAVAEAISDGLPTVVSRNVAMHTFVESNSTGIVISELSAESLRNAILKVNNDIEGYSMNAINSRFQLSWNEVIKKWKKVLCF